MLKPYSQKRTEMPMLCVLEKMTELLLKMPEPIRRFSMRQLTEYQPRLALSRGISSMMENCSFRAWVRRASSLGSRPGRQLVSPSLWLVEPDCWRSSWVGWCSVGFIPYVSSPGGRRGRVCSSSETIRVDLGQP